MKLRISKSEIDLFISRLIKLGEVKLSDVKVKNTRIIQTTTARVTFTSNGWVDIQLTANSTLNINEIKL